MRTHYDVLGVSRHAEAEVIKAAYRALMLKYHPDKNSDKNASSRAKQINEAFAVLSDDVLRAKYDETLESQSEPAQRTEEPTDSSQDRPRRRMNGIEHLMIWVGAAAILIFLMNGTHQSGSRVSDDSVSQIANSKPAPEPVTELPSPAAAPAAQEERPAALTFEARPAASDDGPQEVPSPGMLALSDLTAGERTSVESACSQAKYLQGPAAY